MEIELRKEICKILKEQERESKKSRKRNNASIGYLWQQIQPRNYETLVVSLRKKDMELFDILNMRLYHDQKKDLYNHMDITQIIKLIDCSCPALVKAIISGMSRERAMALFNGGYGRTNSLGLKVWDYLCYTEQVELLRLFEAPTLAFYLKIGDGDKVQKFFSELCQRKEDESAKKEILAKFSDIAAETVAKVLENVDSVAACEILPYLNEKQILEVCQVIEPEMLYDVIRKSKYQLLPMFEEDFPLENLKPDEKQTLFFTLKDKKLLQNFKPRQIALKFYEFLELEDKEYILYELLTNVAEWETLYENLSQNSQMEMLEILAWRKSTGRYAADFRKTVSFLEAKEGRTYLEDLVLYDLMSHL